MKATNTLHKLQQQFSDAVLGRETQEIENSIQQNQFSSRQRLNIYSNNVMISLRNALEAVYPVIHKLVGDEFFAAMSRDYIVQHPSRSGNLHDFGKQMSSFIERFAPAGELVYLADVAKLEWAYHLVFHAANTQPFDIEKLQQVEAAEYGNLVFLRNPASQLVSSAYPILSIWEANQENNILNNTTTISLDEGESLILVVRKEMEIEFQALSHAEFSFLAALENREKFFTACEVATKFDSGCDVGQILQKHILSEAISGFELTNNQ